MPLTDIIHCSEVLDYLSICITLCYQFWFVMLSNLSERYYWFWKLVLQSTGKLQRLYYRPYLKILLVYYCRWKLQARWRCDGDKWLQQTSARFSIIMQMAWQLMAFLACWLPKSLHFWKLKSGIRMEVTYWGNFAREEGMTHYPHSLTPNAAAKVSKKEFTI